MYLAAILVETILILACHGKTIEQVDVMENDDLILKTFEHGTYTSIGLFVSLICFNILDELEDVD